METLVKPKIGAHGKGWKCGPDRDGPAVQRDGAQNGLHHQNHHRNPRPNAGVPSTQLKKGIRLKVSCGEL